MPPVFMAIPAIFEALGASAIPVLSGALNIGEGIANLTSGSPTTPSMPAVAKPAGPSGAQVSTATQAGNNLIAQTGGGLSPQALTQLIGMLDTSGQNFGGAGQGAANTIYGTPG